MTRPTDFVALIDGLAGADPRRGITLVDTRFSEEFLSYRELHRKMREHAAFLHSRGVRRGHSVLIALAPRVQSIAAFLGTVFLGAVPFSVASPLVSQDHDAHRRQILDLVTRYDIDHIIASPGLAEVTKNPVPIPETPDSRRAGPAPDISPADVEADDVTFVQFSSGSSADPKGVRITHRNLIYNINLIADNDRRTSESVWVSWLPLYHDMGLVGGLLSNFIHRNDLILMDPLCFMARPVRWLAAVSRARGTVTAVPNFALDICVDRIPEEQLRGHEIDLSTFRYIYNGAEPVRMDTIRRFEKKFEPYGFRPGSIYPVYGMSESTLIISAPAMEQSVVSRKVEGSEVPSVGYPLGDFRVRIRDEDNRILAAGEIGEIVIHGTAVTPGYLSDSHNREAFGDGWMATGDLGFLDEEGRLYITGRKKDLIIHQGRNFYGHDIAARIETLPFVRNGKVFVFGIDIDQEEKVVVMSAPPRKTSGHENAVPGLDEYREEIRKLVLREFGLPVHDVHISRKIPKTTSGKMARQRGIQLYLESVASS